MIAEKAWTDLGSEASWWGGTDNQTTCQTRPTPKATRIDGVVANQYALPLVQSFEVISDDIIPTHSVVRATLCKEKLHEKRYYIKTLPSLKSLYDSKVEKMGEGKTDKERKEIVNTETWKKKPDVIITYECQEVKESGHTYPR